jgi:Fic family protein
MIPPFQITPEILDLVSSISLILGRIESLPVSSPGPKLRKENRIRTIKSTLAIEGNTFTEEIISAILENKKVVGPKKQIIEVKNAISLYEAFDDYKSDSIKLFLHAHSVLMKDLVSNAGKFRTKNVGIMKGKIVQHVAPKSILVPELMGKLFDWIKKDKTTHFLIKSCVVHYEIEFIHPFEDGNGRMGRFWQTILLATKAPIFKYLPIESLIEKNQKAYYDTLEKSDKQGDSTPFVKFMLSMILEVLSDYDSEAKGLVVTSQDRLIKAKEHFQKKYFSRKDYMELFKSISTATASRDLKEGVSGNLLKTKGEKNQMQYVFVLRRGGGGNF